MEFSGAEIIAIAAVILNAIVFVTRVPTKKDLNDLRTELKADISDLRRDISTMNQNLSADISTLNKSFTDHLMIMHGNPSDRQ